VTVELGVYVLGALEPDEARHVEEHLARCPVCVAELAELAPLPRLLDRVPRADLRPVAVTPSPDLYDRVAAAAARTPRRRVRLLLVAAAVLAVLGLAAGVTAGLTGDRARTASASAGPVQATVTVTAGAERGGSALDVTVAGLRTGEICTMVAVDGDGNRHPAGEWPASEAGDGRWVGWAAVDVGAVDEIVLLGDGGRELVRLDL
jgi:anti-sigma factor RsiW